MPHRVSAVLLAAGSSQRMGRPKQLLPLNGKPVIVHCLEALLAAGLDDIVVVLGTRIRDVITAVSGFPVRTVFNTVSDSDMSGSIRTGLREVDRFSSGILISLADHPLVSSETMKTLAEFHQNDPETIYIPEYENRKGHPVLLPKNTAEDIFNGGTLRDVINRHAEKVHLIPVADRGVILDMDTMDDYRKILRADRSERFI